LRFSLGETYIWCPPHEGVDFDEFWMLGLREWIWIGKCFVSTLEFCWTLPMLQVWTGVWEFYISRATHRRLSWLRRQVVEQLRSILRLATSDGTPWMALKTSIVIGSVLIIINHGDSITQGKYPPLWKILLTYSVPFLVSTWGAISQKGKSLKPRNNIWIQHRASKTWVNTVVQLTVVPLIHILNYTSTWLSLVTGNAVIVVNYFAVKISANYISDVDNANKQRRVVIALGYFAILIKLKPRIIRTIFRQGIHDQARCICKQQYPYP